MKIFLTGFDMWSFERAKMSKMLLLLNKMDLLPKSDPRFVFAWEIEATYANRSRKIKTDLIEIYDDKKKRVWHKHVDPYVYHDVSVHDRYIVLDDVVEDEYTYDTYTQRD